MSLTSFIDRDDVADTLSGNLPTPQVSLSQRVRQPWKSSNYGLIGTAYDYLLRFHLAATVPTVHTRPWVAETGATMLQGPFGDSELVQESQNVLKEAREERDEYVEGGELTDRLIELSIDLARLDGVYRRTDVPEGFGNYDRRDVADLRGLVELLEAERPLTGEEAYLNPQFGSASSMVGGADADVLIDGTLIDVKATKKSHLEDSWWHQLVGYAILTDVEQTLAKHEDELPENVGADPLPEIESVGIYFARHGVLWTVPADRVYGYHDYEALRAWFVKTALDRRGTTAEAREEIADLLCDPFDSSGIPNRTRQDTHTQTDEGQSTFGDFG